MGTTSHNLTTGRTQTMMPSQLPGSSDLRVHACQHLSFEAGAYGTSRLIGLIARQRSLCRQRVHVKHVGRPGERRVSGHYQEECYKLGTRTLNRGIDDRQLTRSKRVPSRTLKLSYIMEYKWVVMAEVRQ